MIRLSNTTKKLQAVLAGAITTNQPQAVVSFYDQNNAGEQTRGADQETNLNSTTDVDICNALGTGKESYTRNIDTLTIYNRDTVSATVTVKIDDGGTESILVRRAIPPSGTLTYDHNSGWNVTGDPLSFGVGVIVNGKVVTSVGSNALTISVKTTDGADPSNASPVYVRFPSATLTESGLVTVAITGAISVVVSSGSTLGHRSGAACSLFAYLINNAGTAELAVSSMPPDYAATFGANRLVSTTAEGGAGAADSATVVYSTTARSNVPWVCVARIVSTQATAGTWASAMTQVDQAPFTIPKYGFRAYRTSNQLAVADATWTKYAPTTEDFDHGGAYDLSGDNRYECVDGGLHVFEFQQRAENPVVGMRSYAAIYVNGVQYAYSGTVFQGTQGGITVRTKHEIPLNTGDYVEAYLYHDRGTTEDFSSGSVVSYFSGWRV